jgi:hypothetical protein
MSYDIFGSFLSTIQIHDICKDMTDITTSIKDFASLNRARGPTWTDATKCMAYWRRIIPLGDMIDPVMEALVVR